MESESIFLELKEELKKYDLPEGEKKEMLKRLMQKYARLLMQSTMSAVERNGGTPAVIDLPDIKRAADLIGIATINPDTVKRAVADAGNWLLGQGPNGTWGWWSALDPPDLKGSIVKIWSTAISIKSLLRAKIGSDTVQIAKGVEWLQENRISDREPCWALLPRMYDYRRYGYYLSPNTYETSCVLLALQEAKVANISSCKKRIIEDGVANLVSYQRNLGSWPIFLTKEREGNDDSDIGATGLALMALSRARKNGLIAGSEADMAIAKAATFLIQRQRECGAWGDVVNTLGSTTKTCDAIRALVESGAQGCQPTIGLGVNWLLRNQGLEEDGRGWGWRKTDEDSRLIASTVENTAFAVIALLRAGQPTTSVSIQAGLRWLLDYGRNGNWFEDTPRVIIALSEYLKLSERAL
jgi:hypothetical protein